MYLHNNSKVAKSENEIHLNQPQKKRIRSWDPGGLAKKNMDTKDPTLSQH